MNTPYVKKYDEFGKLTNPITVDKPYNSGVSKRSELRGHERYAWVKMGLDMIRFLQKKTKSSKNKKSIWQNASGPLETIPLKAWEEMHKNITDDSSAVGIPEVIEANENSENL